MPRGVYDRSESKVKRLAAENEKLKTELTHTKHALEKAKLEAKAQVGEAGVEVALSTTGEQFKILRDTLRELAESRKTLVNSDQMSTEVLNALDSEISSHLHCLAQLRMAKFPTKRVPVAPQPTVPGQVPLPAAGFESALR